MLAHKCIYGNTPEYLTGLIKVKSTTRLNFRSDEEMQDQKRHLETADKPSNWSADDSGGIWIHYTCPCNMVAILFFDAGFP